jgi:hypothetical protein
MNVLRFLSTLENRHDLYLKVEWVKWANGKSGCAVLCKNLG